MRIAITVNGKATQADDSQSIADVLREFGIDSKVEGVAIAINNVVVPRREWAGRRVLSGDLIEIIRAVQGG